MASRAFSVTSKNLKSYGYSTVIVVFLDILFQCQITFTVGNFFPAKTKFLPLNFSLYVRAQNLATST